MRLDAFDTGRVNDLLDAMTVEARNLAEGAASLTETRVAFMRYCGQGHEIAVPLPAGRLSADAAAQLRAGFERDYAAQFARFIPGAAIEVLNWSVTVSAPAPAAVAIGQVASAAAPAAIGSRQVHDAATRSARTVPVYARADIAPGASLPGPALIVEEATSTYVTERFAARVDAGGALVLETSP